MRLKTVAGLLAGLLFAVGSAQAEPGWEKLGERSVNFGVDRDTIMVTAAEGRFRKIRLHVRDRAIHIADLKVHFGNGQTQDVAVRAAIQKGGNTRAIDLNGGARIIKKVTLVYSTAGAPRPGRRKGRAKAGRAHVALWGFRAAGPANPPATPNTPPATPATPTTPVTPATPAQPNMEWVLLGERAVRFGVDRDHIPVTAANGMFNRIRFHVAENDVIVDWIKVTFGNGQVHEFNPKVPVHVKKGTNTRAFDLPGALRVIKRIDLKYRTPLKKAFKGRATVRVFGKRFTPAPAAPATPVPATPVEPATPATPASPAADRGWTRLGTRRVGFGVDRDHIAVTALEGRFKRLRFHVGGNALIVDWVKVTFGNGETYEYNPKAPVHVRQGANSPAIDLPGAARVIKRIDFKYRTPIKKALRGKANVTAFGFRAGVDPTPNNGR